MKPARTFCQWTVASLMLLVAPVLHAADLSGTVRDPSGAVVSQAAVTLERTAFTAATDAQGRFHFTNVPTGDYQLTITKDGFEPTQQTVTLADKPLELTITLKLPTVETSIEVASSLKNSDPNYQALRKGALGQVYRVKNLVLKRDVATLTFRTGSFSFLPPAAGRVAAGVFVGDGHFKLEPGFLLAQTYLRKIAHVDVVEEDFSSLVVYFTDATYDEIKRQAEASDDSPKPHQDALKLVQEGARRRLDRAVSFLETLLQFDDVPNIEADLLAELYNGGPGSFRSFIHGKSHSGLRFIVNPRGVFPTLPAPEEVALVNQATSSDADGIWYLSHLARELVKGASSSEDHRLIAPSHYTIEAAVSTGLKLSATCTMAFRTLVAGVRMVRFELLPDLVVATVKVDGREIPFIQESRHHDGAFYLDLPQALEKASTHEVVFEYAGDQFIRDVGGRVVLMQARKAWYPRIDSVSRATFDLTFRVPRGMTAVGTGSLIKQWRDGAADASQWSAESPISVAGFAYGDYDRKQRVDVRSGYTIESYLSNSGKGSASPSSDLALTNTANAALLFDRLFGPLPYKRIAVAESLGRDALPGLLLLPAITLGAVPAAVFRFGLAGQIGPSIDEALPAEAAREWWNNLVSPASFHDAWLSRGFADFSTALYDQAADISGPEARQHWQGSRDALFADDTMGMKIKDAAPIWFGAMADIHSTGMRPVGPGGRSGGEPFLSTTTSNALIVRKGGFVLNMLRELMWDPDTHHRDFVAMMRDFTSTFANQPVTTENFTWMVEKHIKPSMDLEGNHRMGWFFNEWVYGTEIPSYRLEYSIAPAANKKWKITGQITQSGVSEGFRMSVPIYAKLRQGLSKIGKMAIHGARTGDFETTLDEQPTEVLLNADHGMLVDRLETHKLKSLASR